MGESGLSSPRDWQRSHLLLSNRGAAVGRTEGQLEIGVTGEVHKQHRLHTHFLTPSLYTHYINIFYNKYCVLCADGSTNGVIMRFVGCTETAQNLHKLYRTPARCTTTPSPIPRIPLKVASKRATNPLVPRIESKKYLPAKTQGRRHSQLPAPPQSGKSICDSGRKQPGAMRKRARKGRRLRTGGFQRAQPLARLW